MPQIRRRGDAKEKGILSFAEPAHSGGSKQALRITDYERSRAYYVDTLGFAIDWKHRFEPHYPVFMSLMRDGMQIYLTQHAGDCQVGGLVHFVIADVDGWHAEFRSRGARVAEGPNSDAGFRNMTILDPDGNQLRFMEPSQRTT